MRRALLLATLLVAFGLVLPALSGLAGHPDRAVRSVPLLTQHGRIGGGLPVGQRLRCEGPGLRRIEVALVALPGEPAPLELTLRDGDASGEVLRRATATPAAGVERQWLGFDLEPLEDSAGRWLHVELRPERRGRPAPHSPWVRYHGQVGVNLPWGDRVLETARAEASFRSPLDHLRAVAVASESLFSSDGPVRLRILDEDAPGSPLREALLPAPVGLREGYAFFAFEPLAGSAGRRLRLELEAAAPVRLVASAEGLSFKTFHGLPGTRPGMGGMTHGRLALPDRDLVLRTRAEDGPARGLRRLFAELGGRAPLALLTALLSLLLLAVGVSGRDPQSASAGRKR